MEYVVGQATSDMRDRVAIAANAFERRWTVDALRRVDNDLYEALIDQQQMLHEAYFKGTEQEIRRHGSAMCRGWQAAVERMEKEQKPDDAYLMCEDIPTGTKVAIAKHEAAKTRIQQIYGQTVIVLTTAEVAAMFVGGQALAQVKGLWPDAKIVGSRKIERYPGEPAQEEA